MSYIQRLIEVAELSGEHPLVKHLEEYAADDPEHGMQLLTRLGVDLAKLIHLIEDVARVRAFERGRGEGKRLGINCAKCGKPFDHGEGVFASRPVKGGTVSHVCMSCHDSAQLRKPYICRDQDGKPIP